MVAEAGKRRAALDLARAEVLDGRAVAGRGLPDRVVASWRRSASYGVRRDQLASEYFTELDTASRLVRCGQPVIEQLSQEIGDISACVALTDNRARILSRRDTGPAISRALDRVYFAQGFGYAEGSVGTNGVGTVLEFGESIQIVGAEHFADSLHDFACAGAPVRDPITGRIEGVLDISCFSKQSTPVLHSLVRAAARGIERRLLMDRNMLQQALFDAYSRLDARCRDAVLAVGHRVVMANERTQTLFTPLDLEVLQEHLRYLMSNGRTVDETVALPSGTQARMRGSTIRIGNDVAGIVAAVQLVRDPPPVENTTTSGVGTKPRGRSVARLEPCDSASPAWRTAAATAETSLRQGIPVVVLGEVSTGRCTLLADLFMEQHPDGCVVTHGAPDITVAPDHVADAIKSTSGSPPTLHILCDVDQVPIEIAATLVSRLSGLSGARVAATSSGGTNTPILDLYSESVTVPPLRSRTADIERLAAAHLTRIAPGRNLRLSPDAVRLLVRYGWPGNIAQLQEAIAAAVKHRPVGTIQDKDLPAFCQSRPRSSLRAVDEAERDAIVQALRDATGNRVAAAAALGLARSTLYRKIRQYGITA